MRNFNTNTDNSEVWLTPPYIIHALGPFDLDPCAPLNRPWDTATKHYTVEDDGLSKPWEGRVWLNPPYGKQTFVWMDRLSKHRSGIALIFARTETKGFHETIWEKAHSIFFFLGRLAFYRVTGERGNTCNAPSVLVSYSEEDTYSIAMAHFDGRIKGKLVVI